MKLLSSKSSSGFTLIELVVIIAVIGILGAIAAPSWLSFLNRVRLNTAQAETLSIMRQAQSKAKQEKRDWQASFRQKNGRVQWSVHPEDEPENNWTWNDLNGENSASIAIDESYSTLKKRNDAYHIGFQHKGWVIPPLGRITFIPPNNDSAKASRRCVWVSTYLGAMRTQSDRNCKD